MTKSSTSTVPEYGLDGRRLSKAQKEAALARQQALLHMSPPKIYTQWNELVEESYRLQLAGYKTLDEYLQTQRCTPGDVTRWPHNGYIKKLVKKNTPYFYYYDKTRECPEKEVQKVKVYASSCSHCGVEGGEEKREGGYNDNNEDDMTMTMNNMGYPV
eukprot:Nk52_evm1s1949 gene=Nk52_evmTU1s1949